MKALWHRLEVFVARVLEKEAIIFYVLLGLHSIPILLPGWYPTVDGPAHLHNSRLILNAITGEVPLPAYMGVGNLTTNWLGHGVLALLMAVVPSVWADSLLQLLQILGLPLAFRYLIGIVGGNRAFSVFAFPYTYSFLFFYGFYNFNLSVILALLTLGVWWKGTAKPLRWNGFTVMLLTLLTGFAHIFGLVFLLLAVGLLTVVGIIQNRGQSGPVGKLASYFTFAPGLVLIMIFVLTGIETQAEDVFQPCSELWKNLVRVAPSKGIEYGKEGVFSQWILFVHLLLLVVLPFVVRQRGMVNSAVSRALGLLALLLLAAYFLMPDGKLGYAGFVSARLLLLFFVSLAIAMSTFRWPQWLTFSVIFIIVYISLGMLAIYIKANVRNADIANELAALSKQVRPGSVILPMISSDRFILKHVSGYVGVESSVVLLDNYEASLGYFPLTWRRAHMPLFTVNGQESAESCPRWPSNSDNDSQEIDYVLLIQDSPSECESALHAQLDSTHDVVSSDGFGRVFLFECKR